MNDEGTFGALIRDLSKVFDCIPHDLTIAKLGAYSFQIEALRPVNDYLSNRKSRVKLNETFSSWRDIEYGVRKDLFLDHFSSIYIFVTLFTSLIILILQAMRAIPLYIL